MDTREHQGFPVQAPAGAHALLPLAVVQAEWDQTLRRLRAVATVLSATERVQPHHYASVSIAHAEGLNVEEVERIVFDNLLLAPLSRTVHDGRLHLGGEWLWCWRKAVPWRAEKVGMLSRLVPDAPRAQWTYRYNLLEVGLR